MGISIGFPANLSINSTSENDTTVLSSKATQTAIRNALTGGTAYQGVYSGTSFPNAPTAGGNIVAGMYWVIKPSCTISGELYNEGDTLIASINNPGQNANNWVHSGTKSSLAGLTDVNISSPSDTQTIKYSASAGKWVNAAVTKADVGLANVPNVNATIASNITSGTLPAAQLPTFTGSSQGAVPAATPSDSTKYLSGAGTWLNNTLTQLTDVNISSPSDTQAIKYSASAGKWVNAAVTKADVGLANVPNVNATIASNITSGTLPAAQLPALTGDVTMAAGSNLVTIATMTGDTGSGGTKGLVPAPAAGSAAANSVLLANGTWGAVPTSNVNTKIFYVSFAIGSDTNNGLSPQSPFKTLSAACTAAGNSGNQVCVLPGTDPNDYTISNLNVSITGANSEKGGLCNYTGTITINGASSSIRISGLKINSLIHSGAGNLYLYSVQSNNTQKNGGGYFECNDCDLSNGTTSVNGLGGSIFNSGCKLGPLTINNALSGVSLNNCTTCGAVSLVAGYLLAEDMTIYATSETTPAITAAANATVLLSNIRLFTPSGAFAKVNLASNSTYVFTGVTYDVDNSVLAGNAAPATTYFHNVKAAGSLQLKNASTNNAISLTAPSTMSASYSLKMPSALPAVAGQVLSSDISGNTSWITPSGGGSGGTIQATLKSTLTAGTLVSLKTDGTVDAAYTTMPGSSDTIVSQNPFITNGNVPLNQNSLLHCTLNDNRLVRIYAGSAGTPATWYCQIGSGNINNVTWGAPQSFGAMFDGVVSISPVGNSSFVFCYFLGNLATPIMRTQGVAVSPSGLITPGAPVNQLSGNAYNQIEIQDMSQNGVAAFCVFVTYSGGELIQLSTYVVNESTGNSTAVGTLSGLPVSQGAAIGGTVGQGAAMVRYAADSCAVFYPIQDVNNTIFYLTFKVPTNANPVILTSPSVLGSWTTTTEQKGCLAAASVVTGSAGSGGKVVLVSTPTGTNTAPASYGVVNISSSGVCSTAGGTTQPYASLGITPTEIQILPAPNNIFFSVFRTASVVYAISGTVTGNAITIGSKLNLGNTFKPVTTYNCYNFVSQGGGGYAYFQFDANSYAAVTQFFAGSSVVSDIANFVGVLAANGTAGSVQPVTVPGGVVNSLTGLVTGGMYYINPANGQLTSSATLYPLGKALSTTSLMLTAPIWQAGLNVNYTPSTVNYIIQSGDGKTGVYADETGFNAGRFAVKTGNLIRFTIDANGIPVFSGNKINLAAPNTPASAGSEGSQGDICWDNNYVYICVAPNTWRRATLTTW